jgi:excisionase family DNA binding protein
VTQQATTTNIPALVARAGWAVRRSTRRTWSRREIEQLHGLVGRRTVTEIAREMGRSRNAVSSKLMTLGYRIKADVQQSVGLNCVDMAQSLDVPYELVWRDVRNGRIAGAHKEAGKDYIVPWPSIRRYARQIETIRRRRERALGRINEETITKQEFMRLIGLQETHATRYLLGKVVKAWKVPTMWVETKRWRWEWRVSKRDAERVAKLRAAGKLRLRKKSYRKIADIANDEVKQLKRERRTGKRAANGPRKQAVAPDHYTVAQVAQMVGLSGTQVYQHIRHGRLDAKSVRVGSRAFLAIPKASLDVYREWCARPVKATGPIVGWRTGIHEVHRAGLITLTEAAERFGINRGTLSAHTTTGRIPHTKIGGLRAFKAEDIEAFKAMYRPRGKRN